MIEAPLNVLMGVIVPLLKGDEELSALVGNRVFDHVPVGAAFPYIHRGQAWETPEDADCIPGVEIGFRMNAVSRGVGQAEALRIAHRVKTLLKDAEFDLPEGALAMLEYRRTDPIPNSQDPLTTGFAVEFAAVIET